MRCVGAVCRLSVIWHLCRGYETTRLITSMAARDVVSGVGIVLSEGYPIIIILHMVMSTVGAVKV